MQQALNHQYRRLRLILGDQLNLEHSWFGEPDASVLIVVAELKQEASYVRHHVQKVCAFFAAMEQFAQALQQQGHHVLYQTLDDTAEYDSLETLLTALCMRFEVEYFDYLQPDEYRVSKQLRELALPAEVQKQSVDSEHFLLPLTEIDRHFTTGKPARMETFYRSMRRRLNLLMDDDAPEGGRWNFDQENRKKLSPAAVAKLPKPLLFSNDVSGILQRLRRHQVACIGREQNVLPWPVNREQADALLQFFCQVCLPNFGTYQDAMTANSESDWSLYHSRLSFALNTKILHPLSVVNAAIAAYRNNAEVNLAQVEGFVRQVIGWREFIRGIYWSNMPEYAAHNALSATRQLPEYFWTGKTHMRCLEKAITNSLDHSYAHHIQRLMVTGNFCLLAGIDPAAVDDWYLGIYLDALQWVELPNTRGMALYADGGLVGSKPYAAGGNYIKKMGDYCESCHYNVKLRTGEGACPLNSLYWHFMAQHKERFQSNHRMRMLYGTWNKMGDETQRAVLDQAEHYLNTIEQL
ncbi:MAG: cryptochrome/photolyase family protein [Pseudomonadota bacterium]|nr:cryptochrome/photolyase family protein [Pseudomonadota bacterium]